jgi:hypothetical protein
MFHGHALIWMIATAVGVAVSYLATYASFIVIGLAVTIVAQALGVPPGTRWADLAFAVFAAGTCFVGSAPLGVIQMAALPQERADRRWVLGTMAGGAAVWPLVYAIAGSVDCGDALGPSPLMGAAAGLLYGLSTAVALGMRVSTWTTWPPRPPRPAPRAPR